LTIQLQLSNITSQLWGGTMNCSSCGVIISNGAAFCKSCGAKVVSSSVQPEIDSQEAEIKDKLNEADHNSSNLKGSSLSAFGDWTVDPMVVSSARGSIPLDQVSCCTYDAEPKSIRNILAGAFIALVGLGVIQYSTIAGLATIAFGGAILYFALQSKRKFRIYSTSGYYFEDQRSEIDTSGQRIQEFELFSRELIECRDTYIRKMH
jgi:hypothetical protein